MALYRLSVSVVSAGQGHSAVGKAAYNARARLQRHIEPRTYDFSYRNDLVHEELFHAYGRTRDELWNEVEAHSGNPDYGLLAREVLVALPKELGLDQQVALARELAVHIAETYGVAVDLAVHAPNPGGSGKSVNVHAHILFTRWRIDEQGFGESLEMWDKDLKGYTKTEAGKEVRVQPSSEIRSLRRTWAEMENRALERAGRPERVDDRSYLVRGIDRVPGKHLGPKLSHLEDADTRTDAGDYNRLAAWANRLREMLGPEWDPRETMREERTKERVGREVRALKERILGGLQAQSDRERAERRGEEVSEVPTSDLNEIDQLLAELRAILETLNPEFTKLVREELSRDRGRGRDELEGPNR